MLNQRVGRVYPEIPTLEIYFKEKSEIGTKVYTQ